MKERELLRATPLRIGISTRALFNLEEEHSGFVNEGVRAYAKLQLERENTAIGKGTGFEVVERLLSLNEPDEKPYVEVVLLSQNSPDLSLRAFHSIEEHGLAVKTGSFTSGRSLGPFILAWDVDLFLSNEAHRRPGRDISRSCCREARGGATRTTGDGAGRGPNSFRW
jgi:5'-nucleotidase